MCHPSETVFVTCLKKFYALWATEALTARCWVTMTKSTWQALNPSFWLQVYALKNIVDLSTPTPGARRRHSSNRLVICTLRRAMLQHEVVPKMNYLTIWYYLILFVSICTQLGDIWSGISSCGMLWLVLNDPLGGVAQHGFGICLIQVVEDPGILKASCIWVAHPALIWAILTQGQVGKPR